MTSLPTWAVWVLSFGSPVLAFAGVILGQAVTRRGERRTVCEHLADPSTLMMPHLLIAAWARKPSA